MPENQLKEDEISNHSLPSISILIPTLNSENVFEDCLKSIIKQDYPKDKIEIIIADGGSTDRTLDIAGKYFARIYENPLRTGEAGKAVALRHARNEIVAFIDSDNILPQSDWLRKMVEPFKNEEIVGSEPLYYSYDKNNGYITRYCALLGMNDPICLFLGNYDRYSYLTGKWTELEIDQEDKGAFLLIKLDEKNIPTIGANGFLVRRNLLSNFVICDYLFDIDLVYELVVNGYVNFAKVKNGIIHVFSGSVSTFIRKQRRRIRDYNYYKRLNLRKYPWSSVNKLKVFKFIIYTLLTFPLLFQAMIGYLKKKDNAWFFHILACWLTLFIYAYESLLSRIKWQNQKLKSS